MTNKTVCIDCDAGRRMGCETFCCRLWLRLTEDEAKEFGGDRGLEKGEDGLCKYLDRNTRLCTIWDRRSAACRGYDCNHDDLLQVVLKEGFTSLRQVATRQVFIAKECYVKIPVISVSSEKTNT